MLVISLTDQKIITDISDSLKIIETNVEKYMKLQEESLKSIKSDIRLIKSLLSELKATNADNTDTKPVSRKKAGGSSKKEPVEYVLLYQTFMSERATPNFSDEDNSLKRFIDKYTIASIQEFCNVNGIILKVGSPKDKLYGKIITAITENKRF
jgi:hypothetical protein